MSYLKAFRSPGCPDAMTARVDAECECRLADCPIVRHRVTLNSMFYRCENAESTMNLSQDIHPLTDFKRKTSDFLRQLKETGNPVVLTINGKAELVVQDAASYQRLFDLAERLETIQAVKEGIASADRGEGRPVDDAFDALEMELSLAKSRR